MKCTSQELCVLLAFGNAFVSTRFLTYGDLLCITPHGVRFSWTGIYIPIIKGTNTLIPTKPYPVGCNAQQVGVDWRFVLTYASPGVCFMYYSIEIRGII